MSLCRSAYLLRLEDEVLLALLALGLPAERDRRTRAEAPVEQPVAHGAGRTAEAGTAEIEGGDELPQMTMRSAVRCVSFGASAQGRVQGNNPLSLCLLCPPRILLNMNMYSIHAEAQVSTTVLSNTVFQRPIQRRIIHATRADLDARAGAAGCWTGTAPTFISGLPTPSPRPPSPLTSRPSSGRGPAGWPSS